MSAILYFVVLLCFVHVFSEPAKLALYRGNNKLETSSENCMAGIYMKKPTKFSCACVTGVWGFYTKYCQKPLSIIGGDNYCFQMPDIPIVQVVFYGPAKHTFRPSLNHFRENFSLLEHVYTESSALLDPFGSKSSLLFVAGKPWTFFRKDKSSVPVCLQPKRKGKVFCLVNRLTLDDWSSVSRVTPGCVKGSRRRRLHFCLRIRPRRDEQACPCSLLSGMYSNSSTNLCKRINCDSERGEKSVRENFQICEENRILDGAVMDYDKILYKCTGKDCGAKDITIDSKPEEAASWFYLSKLDQRPKKFNEKSKEEPFSPGHSTITENDEVLSTFDSEASKVLQLHPASLKVTNHSLDSSIVNFCATNITKDMVMNYWKTNPVNCRPSKNALLEDQLKRFVVLRINKMIPSRLVSLEKMKKLIRLSKDVFTTQCKKEFVPESFLNTARDAFFMFLDEDFYYGVENIQEDPYKRIVDALEKCKISTQPHEFQTVPIDCNLKKITGEYKYDVANERFLTLNVPEDGSYKGYEPLIETVWKIFLNSHSGCFKHFLYSNDHHHFSVLMMSLFTRSIYDKWAHPTENQQLYEFILPSANQLPEIMNNIDYCVAATDYISDCPTWMTRSFSRQQHSLRNRKKRSVWLDKMIQKRKQSEIWEGRAFCLMSHDEPESKFNLNRCQ